MVSLLTVQSGWKTKRAGGAGVYHAFALRTRRHLFPEVSFLLDLGSVSHVAFRVDREKLFCGCEGNNVQGVQGVSFLRDGSASHPLPVRVHAACIAVSQRSNLTCKHVIRNSRQPTKMTFCRCRRVVFQAVWLPASAHLISVLVVPSS